MPKREIKIRNELSELTRLSSLLEDAVLDFGLSRELFYQLNLVAEEVVSNIILYGYKENDIEDSILIEVELQRGKFTIRTTDRGIEFNPLSVPPPDDLTKPAAERDVGGLGVYLVRQLMDKVKYVRKDDSNVLVITKNISK